MITKALEFTRRFRCSTTPRGRRHTFWVFPLSVVADRKDQKWMIFKFDNDVLGICVSRHSFALVDLGLEPGSRSWKWHKGFSTYTQYLWNNSVGSATLQLICSQNLCSGWPIRTSPWPLAFDSLLITTSTPKTRAYIAPFELARHEYWDKYY